MTQARAAVRSASARSQAVPDPRWIDLYRLGGIFSLLTLGLIVFAVIAYFIWPYQPGIASTEEIFRSLQTNRLGALFSLDMMMLFTTPAMVIMYLALYVALKPVNESYALIALVMVLVATALLMPTRPVVELAYLSDQYAAATSEAARSQYLAAGEALLSLAGGTAWMVFSILSNLSILISSVLMLRSPFFGKVTAYMGIVLSICGAAIVVPVIGIPLGLASTIASPAWLVLLARDFFRMARGAAVQPGA